MVKNPALETFLDYSVDPINRTIYVGSTPNSESQDRGIDFIVTEHTIKGLISLDAAAPKGDKPINMILNSIGGCIYQGFGIYDIMTTCKNYICCTVFGQAYSMASVILQAADKRVVAPNSVLMIHSGEDSLQGHPKSVSNWLQYSQKLTRNIEDIYLNKIKSKKPKFTRQNLQKMLEFDTILSAKEAVEYGLADLVLGE